MNQARGRLLAATALAQNQDRDVSFCKQRRLGTKLSHDGTDPNKEVIVADLLDIITRDLRLDNRVRSGQMLSDGQFELLVVKGPDQVISSAHPNCFFFPADVVGMTNQDDRQCWTKTTQPSQNVQSIGISVWQVQQQEVWRHSGLHTLDRFPRVGGTLKLPAICCPNQPKWAKNGRIVTNYEQPCCFDCVSCHLLNSRVRAL